MNIFKPMLPAKKGYVEVEINGKRTYRNIETGELTEDEEIPKDLSAEVEQLKAENESLKQSITDLELALVELYESTEV